MELDEATTVESPVGGEGGWGDPLVLLGGFPRRRDLPVRNRFPEEWEVHPEQRVLQNGPTGWDTSVQGERSLSVSKGKGQRDRYPWLHG